mgnify:CR=1 FL=1|tara:strand:+ start:716 stop:1276 length:561 start_codon:yes stop_codon:yes gene_type:complete
MNNINLIIYDSNNIYKILNELKNHLNLNLIFINKKLELELYIKKNPNDLIISNKKTSYKNQVLVEGGPLKITKLMEKINLEILKINFSLKSNISIGRYKLDLNSKKISYNNVKLDLTEQEVKIIYYLSNSNIAVKIEKLQKDIWGYGENLETHTVETHIYRLRKKFSKIFKDDQFILSIKSSYLIK